MTQINMMNADKIKKIVSTQFKHRRNREKTQRGTENNLNYSVKLCVKNSLNSVVNLNTTKKILLNHNNQRHQRSVFC